MTTNKRVYRVTYYLEVDGDWNKANWPTNLNSEVATGNDEDELDWCVLNIVEDAALAGVDRIKAEMDLDAHAESIELSTVEKDAASG